MGQRADISPKRKEKTPEEIRASIEQTRAEMSGTVDEIKERFSAGHVVAKMRKAAVTGSRTAARTTTHKALSLGQRAVQSVKSDPRSFAYIGAGAVAGILGGIFSLMRGRGGDSRRSS